MKPEDLRETRLRLGYATRRSFAWAMGISPRTVESWEHGINPIPGWLPSALLGLSVAAETANKPTTLLGLSVSAETPKNSKRNILRNRVVDLVNEFIKTEGCIDRSDFLVLFGPPIKGSVAYEIIKKPCN